MTKLQFELVSPEGSVLSAQVDSVRVPSSEGEFGALARHSPLMAIIAAARDADSPVILEVSNDGTISQYQIEGGFVDVTPLSVSVLATQITKL